MVIEHRRLRILQILWSTRRLDVKHLKVQSSASTTLHQQLWLLWKWMNMCSKCHKEMALKQERAELAASSIGNLINGSSSSSSGKELLVTSGNVDLSVAAAEENTSISSPSDALALMKDDEAKPKDPSRCHSCKKRVGLTGFNCRCGNTFCGVHRYSEKHDCPFDYRTEARCGNTFCGVHFQLS